MSAPPPTPSLPPSAARIAANKAPLANGINLSLTTVATLFVLARLYSCTHILRRRLYLEEWLIFASLVLIWISVVFMTIGFYSGLGRHYDTLTVAQQSRANFWNTLGTPPSVFGVSVPKMSVVSLLCRVFKPKRGHKIFMWTASILCLLNFCGVSLLASVGCVPARATWDVTITKKRCVDQWVFVQYCYYVASYSAFMDLYLAVYPAVRFHRLTCSFQRKFTLSFMLGLGFFASIAAIYKTYLLHLLMSPDFTYDGWALIVWTTVESDLIVVAACVPTLHPLYERCYRHFQRTWRRRRGHHSVNDDGIMSPDLAGAGAGAGAAINGGGGGGGGGAVEGMPRGFWSEKLGAILVSISSSMRSWTTSAGSDATTHQQQEQQQQQQTQIQMSEVGRSQQQPGGGAAVGTVRLGPTSDPGAVGLDLTPLPPVMVASTTEKTPPSLTREVSTGV